MTWRWKTNTDSVKEDNDGSECQERLIKLNKNKIMLGKMINHHDRQQFTCQLVESQQMVTGSVLWLLFCSAISCMQNYWLVSVKIWPGTIHPGANVTTTVTISLWEKHRFMVSPPHTCTMYLNCPEAMLVHCLGGSGQWGTFGRDYLIQSTGLNSSICQFVCFVLVDWRSGWINPQ